MPFSRRFNFKPYKTSLRKPNSELSSESESEIDCETKMEKSEASSPSVATANDIFTNLRIPDAIRDLPKFEGNPRLLFDFISNVEEIFSALGHITNVENSPYLKILMRAVRNKITGPANEVLDMYGTQINWIDIKQNLILHYSDKRNECSLIKDLHHLKQNNKTVEQFYSEVIEILATLNNYVRIHETDNSIIQSKKGLYENMCLGVFLSGLKEPLGSTIRAMKPANLAVAFANCTEEQNVSYMRYNNPIQTKPFNTQNKPYPNQNTQNFQKNNFQRNNNFPRNNFPNNFQRNNFQNNFQRKPQVNNHFPQSQLRQINWQQNANQNPQNRFQNFPRRTPSFQRAVHPQPNFPTPTPMEVDSSGLTNMRAQMHNVQPQKNLFPALNKNQFHQNIHMDPNQFQQLDFYQNAEDFDDNSTEEFPNHQIFEANFPTPASTNQRDI